MKTVTVEKLKGGYQVSSDIGDKTPTGYSIIQKFSEDKLEEVFVYLRLFFGEDILKKKDVLPGSSDTLKTER